MVVMSLKPREEIGMEIHPYITQFIRVEAGEGVAIVDGISYMLLNDTAIIIPLGKHHNIINTSYTEDLKLYSIYSPPNHPADRVDVTKPAND
jgi:mannose-6-phosphate isomerase-like protein (cupin superfamily)